MQSQYYGFTEGEKMQRILLKLSGEALAGEKKHGFDEGYCQGGSASGKTAGG